MKAKGLSLGSAGSAIAAVCFFLPWIVISCSGQSVGSLSGFELAAGTEIGAGGRVERIPGDPILFVVLVAGLVGLALAYAASKRDRIQRSDGYGLIAVGALPLLLMLYKFSEMQNEARSMGLVVEYQVGLWGVVLGYLVVIGSGIAILNESNQDSPLVDATAPIPAKQCPQCGAEMRANARFCMQCGAPAAEEVPEPPLQADALSE